MRKVIKRSIILALIVLGIAIVGSATWFIRTVLILDRELEAHIRIIDDVNSQLGFEYGTPYEDGKEVFVITAIEPGMPMAEAGLEEGDYPRCSIASLYERIVFSQGKIVTIPIRRGEERMDIMLEVPELSLRDDPSELHWYFYKHRE